MNYNEMNEAVKDAQNTIRMADLATNSLIQLLAGRLRKCNTYRSIESLKEIKKELRDFNAVTGTWK